MKKRIIIHATNTPSDMSVTLNEIEDLNSQDMKSDPMPYHYIINIDGKILKGKPDRELCGHCGKFSRDSLSVAYAGGITINDSDGTAHYEYENTLNETQATALRFLITHLVARHPDAKVTGANALLYPDSNPTDNEPYFDVPAWWNTHCPATPAP